MGSSAPASSTRIISTRFVDAFCNVMRDIYTFIRNAKPEAPKPPAFATFEDGLQSACIVEAILESHRRGGVWTKV